MSKFPGRELVLAIGAPGTNDVAQVTAIGEAGSTRALIDASAYGDDWTDFVVGQQDGSEVAIVVALDPDDTDHNDLVDTYNSGAGETFHLKHADSGFHVMFPVLITALSRGAARDGVLQMSLTAKILSPGVEDVSS